MSAKSERLSIDDRLYLQRGEKNTISDPYISTRFEQSVKWYVKKANKFKKIYYIFSIIGIALPATVPIINSVFECTGFHCDIIITVISVMTSVAASILTLLKAQEKWIHYRNVAEILQTELSLYVGEVGDYKYNNKNETFIRKIETIMSDEHAKWQEMYKNESKK